MNGNGNGKAEKPARRVRTASHAPTGRETTGKSSMPHDGPQGILDGQATIDVSDVTNVGREGHTPAGKFAPGNRFGKGNPTAKRQYELKQIFLQAIEPATVIALAKRLQVEAIRGDLDCMKLLLDHAIGRPSQAVALSGPDGSPLGMNFSTVTAIVLDALAGDPDRRLEVAQRLMELDDAGDPHS